MLVPFFRTLILYCFVIIAVRLMGKRQVGEMQPTELVITILVSAVASVPMQDIDIPLTHGLVPILTLVSAQILISILSLKCLSFRQLLTGKAIVVIRDGTIDQQGLKKLRMSIDDLLEDLRLCSVNDLRQVKQAQLETNGQLSILLNTADTPMTYRACGLRPTAEAPFPVLISDGDCLYQNLPLIGKDRAWLQSTLKQNGNQSPKEVFLLCADKGGNTIFVPKEG